MSYKLDGAKFPCLDDLVEALFPLYEDRMNLDEFRAYAEANAVVAADTARAGGEGPGGAAAEGPEACWGEPEAGPPDGAEGELP